MKKSVGKSIAFWWMPLVTGRFRLLFCQTRKNWAMNETELYRICCEGTAPCMMSIEIENYWSIIWKLPR